MTLKNDIRNKTVYLDEMDPIVIQGATAGVAVEVKLSLSAGLTVIDEMYYPDFTGLISVDVKDILAQYFSRTIPTQYDTDTEQSGMVQTVAMDIGSGAIAGSFKLLGFSEGSIDTMSYIDYLRIPKDYCLFISACSDATISLKSRTKVVTLDPIKASANGTPSVRKLLNYHFSNLGKFLPVVSTKDYELGATTYEICNDKMYQYVFANRQGGFDNIPMSGKLTYNPGLTMETGIYEDKAVKTGQKSVPVYTQNTGYLTKGTMTVLLEYLQSCNDIYYYNGNLNKIVITSLEIDLSGDDNSHSGKFSYRFENINYKPI